MVHHSRAEKQIPRWQPVYDAAKSLYRFQQVHAASLQPDAYTELLEMLSETYYNWDPTLDTNYKWKETASSLQLRGEYEHWVGHDETLSEKIFVRFDKLIQPERLPETWQTESEWPCDGQYQFLDESAETGDRWNYYVSVHKAWLLKNPYGLPGVWCLEYEIIKVRN